MPARGSDAAREDWAAALKGLRRRLRGRARPFPHSQYPFPVNQALRGGGAEVKVLREELACRAGEPPKAVAEVVLSAAEAAEACRADRARYFATDAQMRGFVFTGTKWRTGWVLLVGRGPQEELARRFEEEQFLVFTSRRGVEPGRFLGPGTRALVAYAQLLVRYGLVYARVEPGDLHTMSHVLAEDGPGILVVTGEATAQEALLVRALGALGVPVVVPKGFPFRAKGQVVAGRAAEVVRKALRFPNLRVRQVAGRRYELPPYCNPAYFRQQIAVARTLGDTRRSFLLLRKGARRDALELVGRPGRDLGVFIRVAGPHIDPVTEEVLEEAAAGSLRYLDGVDVEADGRLLVGLSAEASATPAQMAETISRALRYHFPKLTHVEVRFIFDRRALDKLGPGVRAYRRRRSRLVGAVTEDSTLEFFLCVSCQPFSVEHACVITPGRPPMCARRWTEMKVGAYLNVDDPGHPFRRRNFPFSHTFYPVKKGRLLDPQRGEYAGINRAIRRLTGGRIKRVFLHSLFEHPHSSCSCFRNLAFHIAEVDGIGVMNRGFAGRAPDGRSWDDLANLAAGKQQPGVTGVGPLYLRSAKFLQGDGGWRRVVWMSGALKEELAEVIPSGCRIATEKEAADIQSLRAFLARGAGRRKPSRRGGGGRR